MNTFRIDGRNINSDSTPYIIAEAGINHNGEFSKAIECVDAAIEARADCVKFQCRIAEAEMIPSDITPGNISDEKQWDITKRCELTEEEEKRIKNYCDKNGITYLSTPFSREASDRLEKIGVSAFKIGSGECNNFPLLDHIARKEKPIILSTGMNDIASIRKSIEVIKKYNCSLMLLHCTSLYPTPYNKVRLGSIQELRDEFNLQVGFSDHSLGIYASLGAVALGAVVIEKHFTVDKNWPGPDNLFSIDPIELRELIKGTNAIFESSGGHKFILPEEQPIMDFAFASVVTIKKINKGDKLSTDNIWVKRPGTGSIPAVEFDNLLGQKAARDIEKDVLLDIDDVKEY